MCVQEHVCICMCAYVCLHMCESQRAALDVVPQALSTFFAETEQLTALDLEQ